MDQKPVDPMDQKPMDAEGQTPFVNPYQDPAQHFPKPPLRFTKKDWLFVSIALLLGWLCMQAYGAVSVLNYGLAGLGAAVFVTALLGAVLLRLGKGAHWSWEAVFFGLCTLLLGWSNFFSGDASVYFLNAFVTLGAGVLTVFTLSGQLRHRASRLAGALDALGLLFRAIFSHFAAPFRALGQVVRGDKKRAGGVLIGLLCAIPVLAVVLALLSSADQVFSGMFRSLGDWFLRTDLLLWLWRGLRLLLVGLLFCSGLYFLTQTRRPPENFSSPGEAPRERSAAAFITVLSLLCLVYVIFAGVQAVYLFGGAETAAMKNGYAAYARQGFFQLVAVSAINLCTVLLAGFWGTKCQRRQQRLLVGLALGILVLTLVILASALYRMLLYISVYALSLQRILTLWAMLVILVGILAAAWKLLRPGFAFFPVLLVTALATWTLLSLANPRRILAEYNVSAYISGQVEQVDLDYITQRSMGFGLCGETIPALERLRDSGCYEEPQELEDYLRRQSLPREIPWAQLHWQDLTR